MNADRMKQELTRLATRELELENSRVQLEAAVEDAQQRAADLIISGGEPTGSVEAVRHAEIALSSLDRAVHALRGRRTETLTHLREARQEDLRDEIARRLAEITELEAKTRKALAKVAEIQGETEPYNIPFVESVSPKTRAMRTELDDLQARLNNATGVRDRGQVVLDEVTGTQELEQAVLMHESLAPSLYELRQWLHDLEQEAVKRRNEGFAEHSRRYSLLWANGKIDRAASSAFCAALGTPAFSYYDESTKRTDTLSATFKAPHRFDAAAV